MKRILIGSTNPSKIAYYQHYLSEFDIEWYILNDLHIQTLSQETGKTTKETAEIKAAYYGQFFDSVICNDSGLYFLDFPLDDPIQPGIFVRRVNNKELTDEEMINYYSHLASIHGGKLLACYIQSYAIYEDGKVTSFDVSSEYSKYFAFYMCDHQLDDYTLGWPIDSLSIDTNLYTQEELDLKRQEYHRCFKEYLITTLKLK